VGSGQWSSGKGRFEIYDAMGNYITQKVVYDIGCGVRPAVANDPRGGPPSGTGGPLINLYTDKSGYRVGSSIDVSCSIQRGVFPYANKGDVFFWAELPNGMRFYLTRRGTWTRAVVPVYRNVTMQQMTMRHLFTLADTQERRAGQLRIIRRALQPAPGHTEGPL